MRIINGDTTLIIDDLLLPYKIDLSLYHQIEKEDMLDHIKRVGVVFYEKNKAHAL